MTVTEHDKSAEDYDTELMNNIRENLRDETNPDDYVGSNLLASQNCPPYTYNHDRNP